MLQSHESVGIVDNLAWLTLPMFNLAGCQRYDNVLHSVILNGIDVVVFSDKACNIGQLLKR